MAAVKEDSSARLVKKLEKTIVALERQLADARQARFSLPTGRPRGGSKSKSFCRVVIPDTHGCRIDKAAIKAFLHDLEVIQPQEVVWLGDHLDCSGFLSRFSPLYMAETSYTFEEDAAAANVLLDRVAAACPGAKQYYIVGNHEHRIELFLISAALRNRADAEYLRKFFSLDAVLGLDKRKIEVIERDRKYCGVSVPGVLRLGKCHFTHGAYTSANAAKSHLDAYVCNIVYGHTHRADSYVRRTAYDTYAAYCPGALCEQQSYYAHTANTNHTLGYGVQAVQGDGSFLHLNIPIIEGVSYLRPLANQLAA